MAVLGANKSDVPVINERKLFTGIANAKVLAVNPTIEEAKALDINLTKAEYAGKDKEGRDQGRVDFWMEVTSVMQKDANGKPCFTPVTKEVIRFKISFFVTNAPILSSKSENKYWINKKGVCTWGITKDLIEEKETMKWYDTTDIRVAIQGEPELMEFIKSWLNFDVRSEGAECRLDTIIDITKGISKELRAIHKGWKSNEVQVLLGVKSAEKGKFQDVFTGFFGRPSLKGIDIWDTRTKDETTGLGAKRYTNFHIQGSLLFQRYSGNLEINPGEAHHTIPATGVNAPIGTSAIAPDEVPF